MITAPFDYEAPESRRGGDPDAARERRGREAARRRALAASADEGAAGGADLLIDLRKIPGLDHIQQDNGGWRIGPMTRHAELQDTPELGVVARAASLIADQQVRNRGTIGGSLAHGDPASDLPTVLLALDGEVTARGPNGERTIAAGGPVPGLPDHRARARRGDHGGPAAGHGRYGFGYQKFTRRAEDWAMVGVCALVSRAPDGTCDDVRIGLTQHGRHAAARQRGRGGAARQPAGRQRRSPPRPSRPPRAPTRPAT